MGFVRKEYQMALDIDAIRLYYPWDHNGVPLKIRVRDDNTPQSLGMVDGFVLLVEEELRFLNSYKGDGGLKEELEWDEAVLEKKRQDLIAITRSRYLTADQNPPDEYVNWFQGN
jgi:hypothetical protein